VAYRFGDFSLDEGARQLLAGGEEVHLSRKAFDLLAILVANRARAVSKEELMQRVWPGTFVEETNLAGLVAEIRRALADPAASPRFVQTVYGFGYRFGGDVAVTGGVRPQAPRRRACLVVESREIALMNGTNIVGRAPDATIQVDSPSVSRYHARIEVSDGETTLEDLGSKNGTRLDGTAVTSPASLVDGSEIRLGTVVLTFRVAPPASPTRTAPAID
jgi:DNA-binding winged helix-turn-helix (wHTH) protein